MLKNIIKNRYLAEDGMVDRCWMLDTDNIQNQSEVKVTEKEDTENMGITNMRMTNSEWVIPFTP